MVFGVPYHELLVAAVLGMVFGFLGYFITRAIGPSVERLVSRGESAV